MMEQSGMARRGHGRGPRGVNSLYDSKLGFRAARGAPEEGRNHCLNNRDRSWSLPSIGTRPRSSTKSRGILVAARFYEIPTAALK